MTTFVSKKTNKFGGEATLPGDKSISIRALILAALAKGQSRITGLPSSDDVSSTVRVLQALGVDISFNGKDAVIHGVGPGGLKAPTGALDFGNSGTASRLMMGVLAGQDLTVRFTGDASLQKRPFGRVMEPLGKMGANFSGDRLPFEMTGTKTLIPIDYTLPVPSAQVKSAILLAGLQAGGKTIVREPTLTRNHTETLLGASSVGLSITEGNFGREIIVTGPKAPEKFDLEIPGDISAAAFPLVAALISKSPGLILKNVGVNRTRRAILEVLGRMGGKISKVNQKNDSGEPRADIVLESGPLRGITTLPEEAPGLIDEFPILFAAAAFADQPSTFRGLAELRHKESDRLSLMADGLDANGVNVLLKGDDLTIFPGPVKGGARIDACHDHRIAMSFLVLGLGAEEPVTVTGAETISTSFPGFARVMNALGANIEEME